MICGNRTGAKWAGPTALLLVAAFSGQSQTISGGLSGSVEADGKAVKRAVIAVVPTQAPAPQDGGPPRVRTKHAVSEEDGTFSVDAVEDGEYSVCVFAQDEEILNPCEWPAENRRAAVTGGRRTEGLRLTLKRGAVLRVRIEDPEGLLPSFQHPERSGTAVLVGVFTEGNFVGARLAWEESRAFEYRLSIPLGQKVKPFADLIGARLMKANGEVFRPNDVRVTPAVRNGEELRLTLTAVRPAQAGGEGRQK